MIIAIDFDKTYTEDPELWNTFINKAKVNGHRVICVTARYNDGRHGDNRDIFNTIGTVLEHDEIYFSGIAPKRNYMINEHEIFPTVWIDDTPLGIVE